MDIKELNRILESGTATPIKPCERMAKLLNEELQPTFYIEYVEQPLNIYEAFINAFPTDNDIILKEDEDTGEIKQFGIALRVEYPPEYYALPKYLYDADLKQALKNTKNKDFKEFVNQIREQIEI